MEVLSTYVWITIIFLSSEKFPMGEELSCEQVRRDSLYKRVVPPRPFSEARIAIQEDSSRTLSPPPLPALDRN